jgi:hypothetical protein
MNPVAALQLADWRRQTAALDAQVREQADPAAAHALWRDGRDQMMGSHSQRTTIDVPIPAGERLGWV